MNFQDAYFEQAFEIGFLRAKGDEFQTFFERLMGLAYKADFMACRPWGNQGDRKNDGYLKSTRCLFQVYAPYEMEAAKAVAKMTEDFEGAKLFWGTHFKKWAFVHNALDGLPPHCHKLLLDFEQDNPGIQVETWGLEEQRLIFRILSIEDRESWFGSAPTDETKAALGFGDLQVVLERISSLPASGQNVVKDVPMGKIEANSLSESVARLLKDGMVKSPLVSAFFSQWHDATLGDRLAATFQAEYRRLREQHAPNQVFTRLQSWAGGERRGSPEHEMAVLTIIAYFFERCDVFEEPRSVSQ